MDKHIEHTVAGTGVEGQWIGGSAEQGHVRHAAHVEHRRRRLQPRGPCPRQVIDRGQGRTLPSRRHIGGSKVEGHRRAGQPRQQRSVAELHRAPDPPPDWTLVQHRLAMEADQFDLAPRQTLARQEGVRGHEVLARHRLGCG